MIVVAIVAIISSIAIPSYRGYVLRANRSEAKTALLRIQAAQEKYYLSNNQYANSLTLLGFGTATTTERGFYTLQVNSPTVDTFTATATPAGSQVSDAECASFSINESGNRLPTLATSRCWK